MKTALDPRAGMGGTPLPGLLSIRTAEVEDAATLARTLALAFFDDPFATYCAPRASTRLRKLEVGFRWYLGRIYLRHGMSHATREHDGVAVWLPPGSVRLSVSEQIRMVPAAIANARSEILHFVRGAAAFEKVHPREPHYYLPLFGVVPDQQGRGIGHALLQPTLERCDRERRPAYLEATSERSIALYERNGFEVIGEVDLPNGGPPFWRMWRNPVERR